jgi:WD40 repeat protein
VANDSGDVSIINKTKLIECKKWTAHNNAIFDIKWRNGCDHQLVTASGDKSIIIWDVNKCKSFQFKTHENQIIKCNKYFLIIKRKADKIKKFDLAHNGSIKSIDFDDHNVFASGSRDGLIKIWDLRCSQGIN